MAVKWVYEQATGMFLCGGPFDPLYDPATQGLAALPDNPNPRLHRYDATSPTLVRAATEQEVTDYESARLNEQIRGQFDGNKNVLAFAMWTAQRLGVPMATARQEIMAIRRTL
jgi:hypothetical protein